MSIFSKLEKLANSAGKLAKSTLLGLGITLGASAALPTEAEAAEPQEQEVVRFSSIDIDLKNTAERVSGRMESEVGQPENFSFFKKETTNVALDLELIDGKMRKDPDSKKELRIPITFSKRDIRESSPTRATKKNEPYYSIYNGDHNITPEYPSLDYNATGNKNPYKQPVYNKTEQNKGENRWVKTTETKYKNSIYQEKGGPYYTSCEEEEYYPVGETLYRRGPISSQLIKKSDLAKAKECLSRPLKPTPQTTKAQPNPEVTPTKERNYRPHPEAKLAENKNGVIPAQEISYGREFDKVFEVFDGLNKDEAKAEKAKEIQISINERRLTRGTPRRH